MIGTSPSVTHLYAQAILQAAQRRGLTLPESITCEVVPGQRVPLAVQDQLWEEYCRQANDPLAGLDIGLGLQVGHLDSAGMLLVSCDTLRDGLEALVEYAPVVGDGGEFSLSEEGLGVVVVGDVGVGEVGHGWCFPPQGIRAIKKGDRLAATP